MKNDNQPRRALRESSTSSTADACGAIRLDRHDALSAAETTGADFGNVAKHSQEGVLSAPAGEQTGSQEGITGNCTPNLWGSEPGPNEKAALIRGRPMPVEPYVMAPTTGPASLDAAVRAFLRTQAEGGDGRHASVARRFLMHYNLCRFDGGRVWQSIVNAHALAGYDVPVGAYDANAVMAGVSGAYAVARAMGLPEQDSPSNVTLYHLAEASARVQDALDCYLEDAFCNSPAMDDSEALLKQAQSDALAVLTGWSARFGA